MIELGVKRDNKGEASSDKPDIKHEDGLEPWDETTDKMDPKIQEEIEKGIEKVKEQEEREKKDNKSEFTVEDGSDLP